MAGRVVYDANFTAETGAAEANVKRYADQIKQAESVLKQAERTAKQSYGEQMAQARAVGASTEQLSRITQQYNQQLYAIGMTGKQVGQTLSEANRGAISSEDAKAQALSITNKELQAQVAIVNELAAANAHNNHEAVSGVQATSAAIRGLEGSGGIRAVENFISKTLGLGPAMQAIFPIIGGAMFAQMLVDVGEKLYEFRESGVNAGRDIREAYEDLTMSTHKHGVELDLTNDKLDTELAKINHKPANLLKTALDEDRKAAYDLTEELNRATRAEASLMKEKGVGGLKAFGSALLGYNVADTTEQQRLITSQNGDLRRANKAGDDALDHADPKNAEAVRLQDRTNRQRAYTKAIQETGKALDAVYANQREGKGVDFSGQTSLLEGHLDELQGQLHNLTAGYSAGEKQRTVTRAEELKQAGKDGESAARKSLEAQRKAAEEQRKGWADDLAAMQSDGKASADAIHQFWIDQQNATVRGSENYAEAGRHANESLRAVNDERRKAFDEAIKMRDQFRTVGDKNTFSILGGQNSYDLKGITEQQTSLKALLDAQRENTYQQALVQAQQNASLGTITRYDAAVQIQVLHTAEYAAQLKELQDALAAVDGTDNQAIAKRNVLNKQINDLTTKSNIDSMRDSAAVAAQTWQGALTNANAAWVNDSRDSARQVAEIYNSALSGINGNIVNGMMGEKTSWGSTFKGIGKQVASMGLQRAESSLLGSLGGSKKPTGAKGDSLHVIIDNDNNKKDASSDLASKATSLLGGGTSDSGSGMASGITQSLMSMALSFIPGGSLISGLFGGMFGGGRAIGGGVDAGKSYLVGENGPEIATFGSNAYITPNHKLGSALGGNNTAHYTLHVGEGVTSEQMHQQITSTLKQFHPQVVRDAAHAVREQSMRSPSNR